MADSTKGDKGAGMRIDPQLVRDLAELLNETGLNEIEIQDGDRKIKVGRQQPFPEGMGFTGNESYAPVLSASPLQDREDVGAPLEAQGTPVKSPMVGTAFMSAEPGGKAFVAVGDKVKAGDTLLIVEAMKVMNPITAPAAGIVQSILVADAQPVEFDQLLVVLG